MAPRALNLPSVATICQINRSVRQPEELAGALFLDRCGIDSSIVDSDEIGRLLVAASIGTDVETAVLAELRAAAGRHGM